MGKKVHGANPAILMHQVSLEFVSNRAELLRLLIYSKEHGTTIGINAPLLGRGTHITSVDGIIQMDDDLVVILKGYDVTGHMLERNKLLLEEIESVVAFNSKFENPFVKNLNKSIQQR